MNDRYKLNKELAQMLKGGVIMDVTTPEQARIAQEAGACAVMALERIPADIRAAGGVSRMSDPKMIKGIQEAVSIPVMAKCRIGHFAEAQILEAIEIDYIDESEVLSPADDVYHIDKTQFKVPFVCGARDLGEALRRIAEGASMIRTKGEPGTGDVVQAVRHMRAMNAEIRRVQGLRDDELFEAAKQLQVPVELLRYVKENGRLPVVNFAAGGVATPADAALMMHLGAEGVFVGSGIFKSGDPAKRAAAIVQAVTNYNDPKKLAELSEQVMDIALTLRKRPLQVCLTAVQWRELNQRFTVWLHEADLFGGEEFLSVVKRYGLITFRLCMVFTALRCGTAGYGMDKQFCTDEHFRAALAITSTCLEHSRLLLTSLRHDEEVPELSYPRKGRNLLARLPHEFTLQEAYRLGEAEGMAEREVRRLISKLIPLYIKRIAHGEYQKTDLPDPEKT